MKTTFLILIFSLGSFIALHAQSSEQTVAVEVDTGMPDTEVMSSPPQDEPQNLLFTATEVMPRYKGDLNVFFKKTLRLPEEAKRQGLKGGHVFVQFIVSTDGTISDVHVLKGIGYGCDEEAVRVMQLTSGNWESGKQNDKNVRVRFTQPVSFASAK